MWNINICMSSEFQNRSLGEKKKKQTLTSRFKFCVLNRSFSSLLLLMLPQMVETALPELLGVFALCCCQSLSFVWLFVTPWTVAHQAPPSMGFSRQEYWSGLPFPSPGDLPDPEIELVSPALAGGLFYHEAKREAILLSTPISIHSHLTIGHNIKVSKCFYLLSAVNFICYVLNFENRQVQPVIQNEPWLPFMEHMPM